MLNYYSYFVGDVSQEVTLNNDVIIKSIKQYSDWMCEKISSISSHTFDLSKKTVVHIHLNDSLSKKDSETVTNLSSLHSDILFIFHVYKVGHIPDMEFKKNMVFCTNTNNKRLAIKEAGISHCFILVPSAYDPNILQDDAARLKDKFVVASVEDLPSDYISDVVAVCTNLGVKRVITNSKKTSFALKHTSFSLEYEDVSRETLFSLSSIFFVFDNSDVTAYLQPWLYDCGVYGTKKPFIIEDFEQKGIVYSQVFEKSFPEKYVERIPEEEISGNKAIVAREYSLNATFRLVQKMVTYGFTDKFHKNFEKLGGQL